MCAKISAIIAGGGGGGGGNYWYMFDCLHIMCSRCVYNGQQ